MSFIANDGRYNNMNYSKPSNSGLYLPKVSLGLWHNFGSNDSYENMIQMCYTAFDNGITHFDLANNYGPTNGSAEINFGKILKDNFLNYRDELIISTKAGYSMWSGPYGDGGSRKYLMSSLDQSLKRLGLDYVDIFYHHRMDKDTPLEESMLALADIVKSGKALYAAISNYDGETTKRAIALLQKFNCPFVINQSKYSIFDRTIENNGLKRLADDDECGIIAFSPLAQGLLTDKYLHGIPENSRMKKPGTFLNSSQLNQELINKIQALNSVAEERGQTLAQMALSWVLKDNAVTSVLIGASTPQQIQENVKIFENVTFTDQELKAIDEIVL